MAGNFTIERQTRLFSITPILLRLAAISAAFLLVYATNWNYRVPLAGSGVYAYMGIQWRWAPASATAAFALLAALPSLWMPIRIRAPSDVLAIILYVTVFLPTTALLPHLSSSSYARQMAFVFLSGLGLTFLGVVGRVPVLTAPLPLLQRHHFWVGFSVIYIAVWFVFMGSSQLNFSNFALVDVYEERLLFFERIAALGKAFPYAIFLTTFALGPFLVAYALLAKRFLPLAAGAALMAGAFAASTHKTAYLGLLAISSIWFVNRIAGRFFLVVTLLGAATLMLVTGWYDLARPADDAVPRSSYALFRIFGNSAFLTAAYLDFFATHPFVNFTHSFLSRILTTPYDMPYPIVVGFEATGNPDNHANANLWADAVANLGLLGVPLMSIALAVFLYLFNSLTRMHDVHFSSLLLVLPSIALANTGVHSAIISGGLFAALLLGWLAPGPRMQGNKDYKKIP